MRQTFLNLSSRSNAVLFFVLLAFTCMALCLVLANPGYFSHDEFQKLDHIQRYGFIDYVANYVRLTPGDAFGTPVRPLAFFIQGILAFGMDDYPFLVHFAAITMHALVAYLFFLAIVELGGKRSVALMAALIFSVNPMTILATAWSAALMDRLYILFGLLALIAAAQYIQKNGSLFNLVFVFVFSSLGLLSKETAIILPGLLVIFPILDLKNLKNSRFWLAMIAWSGPVVIFLLLRLPAIISSFAEPKITAYRPSFSNVPDGLLVYAAYPFTPTLTEAQNWIFQSSTALSIAILIHAVLLFALFRTTGTKATISYLFFYALFLVPVLMIPIKAAHYMYGSGLVLSLAIATILVQASSGFVYRWIAGAGIFILLLHTAELQLFAYQLGTCMSRAYVSAESAFLSKNSPSTINFQADPGAAEHVLHRLFTGRNQIGKYSPVTFTVSKWGTPVEPGFAAFSLNSRCIVSSK